MGEGDLNLSPRTRAAINEALILVWAAMHFGWVGLPGIGVGTPGPFRALVVYEGVDMPINSDAVIKYLDEHAIKGSKGPEWRQWAKSIEGKNSTADFKRLFALPAEAYPSVSIEHATGRTWTGKFPEDDAEQLAFFRKWGGE